MSLSPKAKKSLILLLAGWTAAVMISISWNIYEIHGDTLAHALTEARTYYHLNLSYREWISKVGGVYVPADKVKPNPYLKVPDRDVTTTGGKQLTLVNPAYMTRMVFEIVGKADLPVINKLTSMKTINPVNTPDGFEQKALESFERGVKEANEITTINGQPYMRLMRPFMIEAPCLKCHAFQGYKVGDVRGAISIAVPLKLYFESEAESRRTVVLNHLVLWLLVSTGIFVISRKRFAEQQRIEESEWRFRTLSESSADWEFWLDENKAVSYTAPSCKAITGYAVDEFLMDSGLILKIIHPDDRDEWIRHLEQFRSPGDDRREVRIVTRDGDIKWLSHVCSPMYSDGRFLGRRSTNRDITSMKIAEEKLRNAYQMMELIFENTHVLIAALDGNFNFLRVNRAYAAADERHPDFFPGRNHFDLYPDKHNEAIFRRVIETGEPAFFYARPFIYAEHPERGITFWDWSLLPIRDNRENIVGLIFTLLNVTDRHKAETERLKLEEQLRQAQKMEAVGQLAGGVAHDFNNILSAIIGYGSMAHMKMADTDPLKPNIQHILDAADRAAQLTHSLLAFSRKQVLAMKPVDLNEIIRRTARLLDRLIGEDIRFETSLSEKKLVVMADSGQIEQVLMNLATNARDAMPAGGTLSLLTETVTIGTDFINAHGFGKAGNYAVISVSDTGTGMDEETVQKIFEPFFTTKETGKGTGLGLAMVYGIVKQHDGYINVYSEPDKGTTFRIYIPEVQAAVDEKTGSDQSYPAGGTETILVAEDDPALRQLCRTVLEEFGYKVIAAENGDDAVEKFVDNKDSVSLLLLDMIMPSKSGPEAYQEIRKIRPGIRALFTSGYTADIVRRKGIMTEDVEVISKPVQPRLLLKKVREVLDR